ncbi:MAG TPA: DegT/DnrJ/EryC1/StrS family aminotransferase [Thermoanaerobaculia bacterium]|nr:DegT/DnrJ/EryC1/StrS family aminotransferase [Thermoanaerobaculia bacterium]
MRRDENSMNVPYLDLARTRDRIAPELELRWRRILDDTAFVLGPEVRELESAFAAYLEVKACAALGNGTDALQLALRVLGLKPGDEVILPAFSFFATASVVALLGGRPVFADVDPRTLNLDPRDAAARVTPRTVGLIGVHLYGRPFDVDALTALCGRHGLWLIEDAAQAHGARWRGRRVGGFGSLAAWSFYPTKNLGCFGDGGALTGNDATLVDRARQLGNHGQTARYHHVALGTNSRLDSLQAAVLNCRLPFLDGDNDRRRAIAARYRERLDGIGDLRFPEDLPEAEPVYHQLTVRTARRDDLMKHLAAAGVGSSIHYPTPLHTQPALAGLGSAAGDLPESTAAAREVLCLPVFPELTDDEVEAACGAVRCFYMRSDGKPC